MSTHVPYESQNAHVIKINFTVPHARIGAKATVAGGYASLMVDSRMGFVYSTACMADRQFLDANHMILMWCGCRCGVE